MVNSAQIERQSLQAQRYRSLFDSNIVGVIAADFDGNITDANDFFLKMVGYGRADLPLRWDALTPPEWRHIGTYRERLMQKLDIHTVTGLVKYAIREGLTSSEPDPETEAG
jgi:PAS domain S-box-containing protein